MVCLLLTLLPLSDQNAKFMEGVSGVSVVRSPKREEIQQQCQYILKWDR